MTVSRQSFFDAAPEHYEIRGLRSHSHQFIPDKEGEYKIVHVADRHCVAKPTKPPAPVPRTSAPDGAAPAVRMRT